jgi:hypothetical protein
LTFPGLKRTHPVILDRVWQEISKLRATKSKGKYRSPLNNQLLDHANRCYTDVKNFKTIKAYADLDSSTILLTKSNSFEDNSKQILTRSD